MSYQQTSLDAYDYLVESNLLGIKQRTVYEALQSLKEATNTMLAHKLGWPINTVTPRIFELRQKGLVTEGYRDACPITKRNAIFWKVKA